METCKKKKAQKQLKPIFKGLAATVRRARPEREKKNIDRKASE